MYENLGLKMNGVSEEEEINNDQYINNNQYLGLMTDFIMTNNDAPAGNSYI